MNRFSLLITILLFPLIVSSYNKQAIEDSLTKRTGFIPIIKPVKIIKIQTKGNTLTLFTNKILSCLSLDRSDINNLKSDIRRWLNVDKSKKIEIYSDKYRLEDLIVDRFEHRRRDVFITRTSYPNLKGRTVALWASHGLYYNIEEDRWKWQRATVWTVVEDIFTCEFADLVTKMLSNAGAEVIQPRWSWNDEDGLLPGVSGMPRWTQAARYWLEYNGFPDSIWSNNALRNSKDTIQNHYREDLRSRPLWVNYMCGGSVRNPNHDGLKKNIDLCLALHTDGYSMPNDTLTVGTMAIYSDIDPYKKKKLGDGSTRLVSRDYADYIQHQIVSDMRTLYCPSWTKRQLLNANYFEVTAPVVPSAIIEIFSHYQMCDMQFGLNPRVRFDIARAIYKGILRFLQRQHAVIQPLPVSDFCVVHKFRSGDSLSLSWKPTLDLLEPTATPKHYTVQIRHRQAEPWHDSLTVKTPFVRLKIKRGLKYDFRVIAVNEGGKSFPSETLSAYLSTRKENSIKVLIVNGFNTLRGPRWFVDSLHAGIIPGSYAIPYGKSYIYIGEQINFERSSIWINDDECGFGMCNRNYATKYVIGNTFDYPSRHGDELIKKNISYTSCNISTFDISLCKEYDVLDIIFGKEILTDSQRIYLTNLVDTFIKFNPTNRVLVSGSYWGEKKSASHSGEIKHRSSILTFHIIPNDKTIQAEEVSTWETDSTMTVLARYTDSQQPAGVYKDKVLSWGLPLESFNNFDKVYNFSISNLLNCR